MTSYEDTIDEFVQTQDYEPEWYQLVENFFLDDGFRVGFDMLTWAYNGSVADGIGTHEDMAQAMSVVLADIIGNSDSQAIKAYYGDILSDRVGVRDTLIPGLIAMVAEGIGTHDVAAVAYALVVIESLGLTEVLAPALRYGLTVSETVRWMDSLANFFSGIISEGIGTNDALINVFRPSPVLAEGIGVNDAMTQKLVFRVEAADTISLDDIDLQKLIFAGELTDGIKITLGFVSPTGSFTTWVFNTKTMAATEYQNFTFNSFAQMGNRYLAAAADGVYELDGDTDAGTNVIARIKSGLMQLGGSRFTSFKAAYLGMTGSGQFLLKLETGDGKTYTYAVNAKSRQTTRVVFGKGLRARYFAFELISSGQDFDLDGVEFVPLVAERRV